MNPPPAANAADQSLKSSQSSAARRRRKKLESVLSFRGHKVNCLAGARECPLGGSALERAPRTPGRPAFPLESRSARRAIPLQKSEAFFESQKNMRAYAKARIFFSSFILPSVRRTGGRTCRRRCCRRRGRPAPQGAALPRRRPLREGRPHQRRGAVPSYFPARRSFPWRP